MLDFGMPMGPMRLADEVGLDVAQHVAKDLERRLRSAVPLNDALEQMIARGWLGRKSGRGFYRHDGKKEQAVPASEIGFLQAKQPRPSDDVTRRDRLVLIMINEAARVLAEGVVAAPEDVDFGMIMGTGWAPFRGGPLRYADSLGAAEVVRRLEILARDIAPHFDPCDYLREMAEQGGSFYSRDNRVRAQSTPSAAVHASTPPPVGAEKQSDFATIRPTNSDHPSAVPEAV
jgi:3-hydroxyacyl-CoA dehydrogenase/enoyl-CoA hydratase/3-hydroxybutyryl-CoA epimerase